MKQCKYEVIEHNFGYQIKDKASNHIVGLLVLLGGELHIIFDNCYALNINDLEQLIELLNNTRIAG